MISAQQKQDVISQARRHDNDAGSPEVQISLLTARIQDLSQHMRAHKKDFHSRRGLIGMVSKRNRLLRYLSRTDNAAYQATIARLGLRK
ncbi:MAG: 30S ribosomal protein S15 [Phycisphaerales bacterium]|jgi:small subunit ribosomal protein S15|nr:30S ribosomal protein S15 [Phycisphaerales bacterium]